MGGYRRGDLDTIVLSNLRVQKNQEFVANHVIDIDIVDDENLRLYFKKELDISNLQKMDVI